MVLLGPGVMLVTSANRMPAGNALRKSNDMAGSGIDVL